MKKIKTLALIIGFSICLVNCAGNTRKDAALTPRSNASTPQALAQAEAQAKDSVSIEAKLAAAQKNTTDVTEVTFARATRTLPKAALKKIEAALSSAEGKAKIEKLTILAWSDQEMPTRRSSELPKADQKLATDRAEYLKANVEQKRTKLAITLVNMAQKPSGLKRFLKTESVRMQQAMELAGSENGKAGHAILIIELVQN